MLESSEPPGCDESVQWVLESAPKLNTSSRYANWNPEPSSFLILLPASQHVVAHKNSFLTCILHHPFSLVHYLDLHRPHITASASITILEYRPFLAARLASFAAGGTDLDSHRPQRHRLHVQIRDPKQESGRGPLATDDE